MHQNRTNASQRARHVYVRRSEAHHILAASTHRGITTQVHTCSSHFATVSGTACIFLSMGLTKHLFSGLSPLLSQFVMVVRAADCPPRVVPVPQGKQPFSDIFPPSPSPASECLCAAPINHHYHRRSSSFIQLYTATISVVLFSCWICREIPDTLVIPLHCYLLSRDLRNYLHHLPPPHRLHTPPEPAAMPPTSRAMRGTEFENKMRHAAATSKPKTPGGSPVARHTNGPDARDLRAALEDAVATPTPSPSRKRQRVVYGDRCVGCWTSFLGIDGGQAGAGF
jgi:hypothetical protein